MEPIRVGMLLPLSTILPIAKDFKKGVKQGLKEGSKISDMPDIEIVEEFVGQGGNRDVQNAINKLFNYNDVDIVTGVVSDKVTSHCAASFKKNRIPFIVNDLGGYVPSFSKMNEYIFINSFDLWQHAWILGYEGVRQFGKKGMFIGSTYDAGYHFPKAFHEGMMAADPLAEWSFSIPPLPPRGSLSDMSVIFPFLEKYQPDFIFAAFCGAEASLFLENLIRRGWHKKIVITALPFLFVPDIQPSENITVYTTEPDLPVDQYSPEQSFFKLGRDTGLLIAEAASQTNDVTSMQELLLQSERLQTIGGTNFLRDNAADQAAIWKNELMGATRQRTHIGTYRAVSLMEKSRCEDKNAISAGWMNPYLCI